MTATKLATALVAVFLCVLAIALLTSHGAYAHESYTGRNDPVTTLGCCGGGDCAPVPLDVDWVQPVEQGYRVTLTVDQAKTINQHASQPIDVIIPWARVMIIGTLAKPYTGPPALYHICIVTNQVRCLFASPGT